MQNMLSGQTPRMQAIQIMLNNAYELGWDPERYLVSHTTDLFPRPFYLSTSDNYIYVDTNRNFKEVFDYFHDLFISEEFYALISKKAYYAKYFENEIDSWNQFYAITSELTAKS